MLSGIFGKKSDHPMSDIKSAQAFLDELPKNDAHKTLAELTDWIESVSDNADFKAEHQFAVLRLLDEAAQPCVRKLARDYFTPSELNKFQENRLWLVLGNYFNHAARAYFALFRRGCDGDKGVAALKAQEPLLAARAAYALTGQLKYICARYGTVDSAIWSNAARLWQHAEQHEYLDKPVVLYSGAAGDTTVKYELGHLLGWYGCGVSTMRPLHIHLSERITGQYRSSIVLSAIQDESCMFSFDLDCPSAPMLAKLGSKAGPSIRFIGMAAMQPKLEALLQALEKNIVPESLNLGGTYGAELVREAAQQLLTYLVNPPSRRAPRRGINVNLNVVNGFARLLESTGTGLDLSKEQPMHWRVEDISASGFRAVLTTQGSDGIRIGSLLGTQPDGVAHWGAAVVRRLRRDDNNRLHVGAEMLTSQVAGVELNQSGGGVPGSDGQSALWLQARQGGASGEARLLMKGGTFSAQRSLQTQMKGQSYLLLSGELQEKGMDYDLAKFRLIQQEGVAEET